MLKLTFTHYEWRRFLATVAAVATVFAAGLNSTTRTAYWNDYNAFKTPRQGANQCKIIWNVWTAINNNYIRTMWQLFPQNPHHGPQRVILKGCWDHLTLCLATNSGQHLLLCCSSSRPLNHHSFVQQLK